MKAVAWIVRHEDVISGQVLNSNNLSNYVNSENNKSQIAGLINVVTSHSPVSSRRTQLS